MPDTVYSLPSASGCPNCCYRRTCGGVEGVMDLAGCTVRDHSECTARGWTCFCKAGELAYRANEVDGFTTGLRCSLDHRGIELPLYVPTIHHGSSREVPLDETWAALPLYALFRVQAGRYVPVAESPAELRRIFRLADSTNILALGTDDDQKLEDFWQHHQAARVGDALKRMEIGFVSVPNFSYFLDAPPTHTLYNRSRILRVTERLTNAGLQVGLHLNAYLPTHWDFWEEVLRAQSFCRIVSVEFQTGLKSHYRGAEAYESLIRLQARVGRPLRPILIAGQKYLRRLPQDFERFTIVDSTPFMRAMFRRVLKGSGGGESWNRRRTKQNAPVDDLLKENIASHRRRLERKRDHWRMMPLPLTGELNRPRKELPAQRSVADWALFAREHSALAPAELQPPDSRVQTETPARREAASYGLDRKPGGIWAKLPVPRAPMVTSLPS